MYTGSAVSHQRSEGTIYYWLVRIPILLTISLISVGLFIACHQTRPPSDETTPIAKAFEQHAREVQVEGEGVVSRILPDDNSGSPHQRFIVRLASGQTVLIEHNIELAPRIDNLTEGDSVSFSGEYIWNTQGGLVHWTHHDPAGRHVAGWLKHNGRIYQ
jgi:hypothetical protein